MINLNELDKFTISPSQIEALNTCELNWAFQHIRGLADQYKAADVTIYSAANGKEIKPRYIFNVFGDSFHTVIKRFHEKEYKSPESFAGAFTGIWKYNMVNMAVAFAYNSTKNPTFYRHLGRSMAETYWRENIGCRDLEDVRFEMEFLVGVRTDDFLVGFNGRMDRFHREGGRIIITDFKTGIYRPTDEEMRKSSQFIGYSFGCQRKLGETPVLRVYFPGYDVKPANADQKPVSAPTVVKTMEFGEENHAEFLRMLNETGKRRLGVIRRAGSGEKLIASYGPQCNYCKFSLSGECDAYTGEDEFVWKEYAVRVPSAPLTVRKRKIEGQKRLPFRRKEVIIVGHSQPTEMEEDTTPKLF